MSSFRVSIILDSSFRFLKSATLTNNIQAKIVLESPLYNKHQLLNEITSYPCQIILNSPNAELVNIASAWSGILIEFVHESQLVGRLKKSKVLLRICRLLTRTISYIVPAHVHLPSDPAADIDRSKGKVLCWLGLPVWLSMYGHMHTVGRRLGLLC